MKSPRILIVRLSAIGDAIQTMPVACALRDRFPEAFLVWAVESRAAALLKGHQAIDELILLPRGWLKSPGGVWRLRQKLRSLAFDISIDVQGLTKSAFLARLSGASHRIGFKAPMGRELSTWLNNDLVQPTCRHVVDCYLELLKPLGVQSPTVRFNVPTQADDETAADRLVTQSNLTAGFAVINPGAGWPSKLWPLDRYATVARHLHEHWQIPTLIVWAGDAERTMAERVTEQSGAMVAPPTTLTELAAITRRARLFIGSDTGPLHLAAAVGTPCVGLYGPWPASRHGPYGPQNVALQQMIFEGSSRGRRSAPSIYMESITTDMVLEACDRILSR